MIDQGQGGVKLARENRKLEWKILIGDCYPLPQVSWTWCKDDQSLDLNNSGGGSVRIYEELHLDGMLACLSIGKCKVRQVFGLRFKIMSHYDTTGFACLHSACLRLLICGLLIESRCWPLQINSEE